MEFSTAEAVPPYREIFSEFEGAPVSTIDAYVRYRQWLDERGIDPSIYLSTAITSGGLTRNADLTFSEIMDGHTEFGGLMAEAIVDQYGRGGLITREDIVVPSELGKVPGWGQADYLLFWAHVITGLDPCEAALLDDAVRRSGVIERPGFREKSLPREEKLKDYAALAETYVASLRRLELGKGNNGAELPRNIQAVVLILDPAESLGANAERYLCHLLGIGEWVCELNRETLPPRTIEWMGRLAALGAGVLPYGTGNVWGIANQANYWQLRGSGVRLRKPGITAILEQKEFKELKKPSLDTPLSSAQLWAEYYDATLVVSSV
jgi:hypothetical protein